MQKVIDIPFDAGSEVWVAGMTTKKTRRTCPTCKGVGSIRNEENIEFRCINCLGKRYDIESRKVWTPIKKHVETIVLFINENYQEIETVFFDKNREIDEETGTYLGDSTSIIEHIFTNEKQCVDYCEDQNINHSWEWS